MTQRKIQKPKPTLFIKRFLVLKSGEFAYDQKFKMGVNIIRGDNGTGKSTIMDLIYYALGAEVTEWTDEQEICDATLVEVLLNYKLFCLKREITDTGKAAMYFFDGSAEEALESSLDWHRFPSSRSKEKHSFSQQIFELLGLPSHQTDDSKNLTMHQILRLMYVDQITATTKLLKEEKVRDSPITRRAIGEFLLGVDDLEAHNLRQRQISAIRRFEEFKSELKTIYRFVSSDTGILKKEHVDAQVAIFNNEIKELEAKRLEFRDAQLETLEDANREKANKIRVEVAELADIHTLRSNDISEKRIELIDIVSFLSSLEMRKKALENSNLTDNELGELIFEYCPACLSPLSDHKEEGHCALCKTDLSQGKRHIAYIRMINEINFQIRESRNLIEQYEADIETNEAALPDINFRITNLKDAYSEILTNASALDAALTEIGAEIGFNRAQISNWNDKLGMIEQVDQLIEKKAQAQRIITEIENELEKIEASNLERRQSIFTKIESSAKKFIIADGGYENVFKNPEDVFLDFAKDKMAINGRSKFSASSMVIMKNSIRMSIFLASVNDTKVRLPRFMLLDNIEDKGMMAERSQNFQRLLVSMCDELESDYQIIFTTSMIDPDLNNSDYVVGPFYKKGDHTLKIGEKVV